MSAKNPINSPALNVVLTAARHGGGKLERTAGGYWRVPGKAGLYANTHVRDLVALRKLRYSKQRHFRGKYIAKEAVVVGDN